VNARTAGLAVGAALAANFFLVAAKAAPAAAPAFELEPAGSSLRFTAIQQAAMFESRFEKFTALVRFDPAEPEKGQISARVDLASVDTGNPERDQVLGTADWFNLGKWPEARFNAERIVRSGEGYAASGTLTLRGVTRPVVLKFRWTPAVGSGSARLVGSAALERLAFGVGQGEWQDTAYVGNPVTVEVDIQLRQVQNTVNSVSTNEKAADAR